MKSCDKEFIASILSDNTYINTKYLYQVQFDAITSIIRHQTVVNETKITSMFYFRI